jgi:hypothetical protein
MGNISRRQLNLPIDRKNTWPKNIVSRLLTGKTREFSYRPLRMFAAIGPNNAVAEVCGIRISGIFTLLRHPWETSPAHCLPILAVVGTGSVDTVHRMVLVDTLFGKDRLWHRDIPGKQDALVTTDTTAIHRCHAVALGF